MMRWIIGIPLSIAAAYLLVVIAAALFQRSLIYHPTKLRSALAERAATEKGFIPWRNSQGQIIGWKFPSSEPHTANVLIVHGNAGVATDRDYFARPIHDAAAVDVYILEYPGYGMRDGSPSMTSLLAAADEALNFLPTHEPLYVVGESLGSGVAAHLAQAQPNRVAGLALFMPYDDLAAVAQSAMPFLPVSLVLREKFHPAAWLEQYRGPIKVVLASADEVIPARFGQRLYDGYAGPKELLVVPGARHNDVAGQSAEWWKSVFSFWQHNKRVT
jgi:pimeloyl-ACP methyl ester carboxylesterase